MSKRTRNNVNVLAALLGAANVTDSPPRRKSARIAANKGQQKQVDERKAREEAAKERKRKAAEKKRIVGIVRNELANLMGTLRMSNSPKKK